MQDVTIWDFKKYQSGSKMLMIQTYCTKIVCPWRSSLNCQWGNSWIGDTQIHRRDIQILKLDKKANILIWKVCLVFWSYTKKLNVLI